MTVLPPSRRLQRHWVRYSLMAAGAGTALMWLYRHSWLAGSPDLENWVSEASDIVRESWRVHIVQPLVDVRNELFKTFRE